jgi:hypothetical protein
MKKQLRAICAACGREQAVSEHGYVAQHGYTVDHGFFNGICRGAREKHFGTVEGREFRRDLSNRLAKRSVEINKAANDVESGKQQPTIFQHKKVVKDPMPWQIRGHVEMLRSRAASMLRQANNMMRDVEGWQERFPREVVVEERLPVLHLSSNRWRGGKLCAASYTGSRKGAVTTNPAAVTCPKCMKHFDFPRG